MQTLTEEDDAPTLAEWHGDSPHQARVHHRWATARASLLSKLRDLATPAALKASNRIADCCRYPHLYQDDATGLLHLSQGTCRHRLCPKCASAHAYRTSDRVRQLVDHMDSPRFLTLTVRSSVAPLAQQLKHLTDSYRRLRRSREWAAHAKGAIAVVEVTWNPQTQQWHPHLHVLADGTFWPQKVLAAAWKTASQGSEIVDIRAVRSRREAAEYLSKYVSKLGRTVDLPAHAVEDQLEGTKGLRTLITSGSLHGSKIRPPAKPERPKLSPLNGLALLIAVSDGGDPDALAVLRTVAAAVESQPPRDSGSTPPELAARHRTAAECLRAWVARYSEPTSGDPPPDLRASRPRDHPPDGTIGLWQDDGPSALVRSG